jgi:hypothetical protein
MHAAAVVGVVGVELDEQDAPVRDGRRARDDAGDPAEAERVDRGEHPAIGCDRVAGIDRRVARALEVREMRAVVVPDEPEAAGGAHLRTTGSNASGFSTASG